MDQAGHETVINMPPINLRPAKVRDGIAVQLTTAAGTVYSGMAQAAALQTIDGTIDVTAQGESYLSLACARITIHTGEGECTFQIENGTASVKTGRLTVLAERISEIA